MSTTQISKTPPRVVALAGTKGGIGKSTLAACLAAEAMARGKKVLLVDADPQGTTRTWADVAAEKGHPVPPVVAMGATMHKPGQLDKVAEGYDLVVIDCPGREDGPLKSALLAADVALLPCSSSGVETWALTTTLDTVETARGWNEDLSCAIVLNKHDTRTAIGRAGRESIEAAGVPVLRTAIGDRVAFKEAMMAGMGVTAYAPKSPAAKELQSVYEEVFGRGR